MLWIPLAHAASVAVIDFDAQGQSFSTAQRAAEALRNTLLEERLLEPLSARDVADGVSSGKDNELRLGRQKVAEARRLQAVGDAAGCAERAGEAGDLLLEAASDVGRRIEVADVYYLQGTCYIDAGMGSEAYFAFAEVTRQYPGYLTERAADPTPASIESLALAQAATDGAGPRQRPPERLAALQAALGTDYVVTGYLDRKAKLTLALYQDGRLVGEAQGAIRLPPSAIDPTLMAMAHRLVQSVVGSADAEEMPSLDPDEILAEAAPPPPPVDDPNDERGSVARRWWVWATAALVAGGGATAVVLLTGDPPDPTQGASTWSVRIPID